MLKIQKGDGEMKTTVLWKKELNTGVWDRELQRLYPDAAVARERFLKVLEGFEALFGQDREAAFYSGPGRTEMGGNHTDHQHGKVVCASVDRDMLACVSPNGKMEVCLHSQGYAPVRIPLEELSLRQEELGTSAALVRGVAAGMKERGSQLRGFDAYVVSNVLSGSGLSSSAAYEMLVAGIFNDLDGNRLDTVTLAQVSQFAENVYFGKPCGLMDQIGSGVGGAAFVDFADPQMPVVEKLPFDFAGCGYSLCIIDTGSNHDDLTHEYASIRDEMQEIAGCFGRPCLRQVPEEEFYSRLPQLRKQCGDRAVLRSMHYYADDRRATQQAEALRTGDFRQFLQLVNASGVSSAENLQNIHAAGDPRQQAVAVALALGKRLLKGEGAIRVHGGGFAGTIQAYVPKALVEEFRSGMDAVLGEGKCMLMQIRPAGAGRILKEKE